MIFAGVVILILLAVLVAPRFIGKKPFKNLDAADISAASVHLTPPDEAVEIVEKKELAAYLEDVVIYNKDNSCTEYSGQGVVELGSGMRCNPGLIDDTPDPEWGVTLTAKDVTPTGLTLVCTQSGGESKGELQAGSWYNLAKKDGDSWSLVEQRPQEHDVAWTAEAWIIPKEDTVEWQVDWEWLYGELPAGTYRIGKSVDDVEETGGYDTLMYYTEFEVK